jgi:hypothetical protein
MKSAPGPRFLILSILTRHSWLLASGYFLYISQ